MKQMKNYKNSIQNTVAGLLMLFIFIPVQLSAQNRAIEFETGSWAEVIQKAKKENKPIFVDAFAVWCGPCKWMAKTVFTNDTVADFYNTNFVNVKMDMEKGEGIELAKQWKIQAYPTLLYFSPEGDMIHRICGAYPANEFVLGGENALNPEKQFAQFVKKYENGNRDPEFLAQYVQLLAESCMGAKEEMEVYFATQKDEELTNERNWNLTLMLVDDMNSRVFKHLENNKKIFEEKYGKEGVDEKVEHVYTTALMRQLYKKDEAGYEKVKQELIARKNDMATKAVTASEMKNYEIRKEWDKYANAAGKFVATYAMDDSQTLNSIAWTFYEQVKDPKQLKKAVAWAKKSVSLSENPFNLDTYAHLLNATGNKKEAIAQQKRAIELAKEMGDPMVSDLENSLKVFEGK